MDAKQSAPSHRSWIVEGVTSLVPEFDEATGCPPPGRYRVTPEQAFAMLVEAERFAESTTRRQLWSGLERYLVRFFTLEDMHSELLPGMKIVHCLWLGGSYVSTKVNPDNIDLTVFIDDEAAKAYRGKAGAPWLREAFDRRKIKEDFGLSPLRVAYRPIASVFQSDKLATEDQGYLRDRGAWDDWWQRRRQEGTEKMAPTVETAHPARGYLEVTP
ncbi:DUF6932 family protein [Actinomadura sediminis]|uniref:DUF6932 family protein n=1 Tax=Actinomadura sediminis TaxID=1038904 RepID=A0ABW3EST6_9ACTN